MKISFNKTGITDPCIRTCFSRYYMRTRLFVTFILHEIRSKQQKHFYRQLWHAVTVSFQFLVLLACSRFLRLCLIFFVYNPTPTPHFKEIVIFTNYMCCSSWNAAERTRFCRLVIRVCIRHKGLLVQYNIAALKLGIRQVLILDTLLHSS